MKITSVAVLALHIGAGAAVQRRSVLPFETARQVQLPSGIPRTPAEQATAFNRFSPRVAGQIWRKGLNESAVLDRINADFDRCGTSVAQRQVQTSTGPVDPASIVLKTVFQTIDGQQPTAIPVWTGISPQASTNLNKPSADTWRRCVVVDPGGRLQPGSRVRLPCDAEPAQRWPVVPLSEFPAIRLIEAQGLADGASAGFELLGWPSLLKFASYPLLIQ
jgi:hypothetical protein